MSYTTSNLLLSAMWFGLSLLTPWAVLPAVACLACAVANTACRLEESK